MTVYRNIIEALHAQALENAGIRPETIVIDDMRHILGRDPHGNLWAFVLRLDPDGGRRDKPNRHDFRWASWAGAAVLATVDVRSMSDVRVLWRSGYYPLTGVPGHG